MTITAKDIRNLLAQLENEIDSYLYDTESNLALLRAENEHLQNRIEDLESQIILLKEVRSEN